MSWHEESFIKIFQKKMMFTGDTNNFLHVRNYANERPTSLLLLLIYVEIIVFSLLAKYNYEILNK